VLFIGFSKLIIAQTTEEQNKIKESYSKEAIELLNSKINKSETIRLEKIESYLRLNSTVKKVLNFGTGRYTLIDIIDGQPIYQTSDNSNSAIATRTNFMHLNGGLGLDIEGQNMNIGVWDEGLALSNHTEFSTGVIPLVYRVTTPDMTAVSTFDDHATHVTGTLVARGADPLAKGMAPQASAISYDWDNDSAEIVSEVTNNALLISNQSYGIPVLTTTGSQNAPTWMMGNYNSDAALADDISYTFPYYLQVLSAGNDGQSEYTGGLAAGYDKLTGDKNAKNNLVVANAANPLISSSGELTSMNINASSSQGPSDDGRIKPDITGDGTNVYSTNSTSVNAYGNSTGTSMSSPNVAGSILLLQQYYNSLNSQYMKAATLKGLVCHTADDDSGSVGPDAKFGWGLLNTKYAAEVIEGNGLGNTLISELNLENGALISQSFTTTGNGPVSVTICWTDPSGNSQNGVTNSSIAALVNDLDLRVKDPGGFIIYQPWKLLRFNLDAGAITGDNTVDTVENIDIDSPSAGTYTIEVSHKGTLQNLSQDFSLIVTAPDFTLSNNDFFTQDFVLSPNPNKGEFNIRFSNNNNQDVNVKIHDLSGRTVYLKSFTNNSSKFSESVNLKNVQPGVYVANITSGNNSISKKVIIE
jgi:hypothetical protein